MPLKRATDAVFRALYRRVEHEYAGTLKEECAGDMFSTKSMEEYRAGAIDWLSDKSNLSSKTLRNADWQEIYETFNPDITPQWLQPNATQAPEVKAPAAETVTEYGVRILGSDSIMHVTTDEAEAKRRLAKAREIYPAATMVTRQVQATPWEVANK